MLRSAVAIVLGTAAVSWAGASRDISFREPMVPVKMADGHALHVSRLEVTVADWQRCVKEQGCAHSPKTLVFAAPQPVTGSTGLM